MTGYEFDSYPHTLHVFPKVQDIAGNLKTIRTKPELEQIDYVPFCVTLAANLCFNGHSVSMTTQNTIFYTPSNPTAVINAFHCFSLHLTNKEILVIRIHFKDNFVWHCTVISSKSCWNYGLPVNRQSLPHYHKRFKVSKTVHAISRPPFWLRFTGTKYYTTVSLNVCRSFKERRITFK